MAIHPISAEGRIIIWFQPTTVAKRFELDTDPISFHQPEGKRDHSQANRHPWFGIWLGKMLTVKLAHCVLAMVAGALAIVPWCPRKFSVRTLLIATTVIAAVVGVIVWADQL